MTLFAVPSAAMPVDPPFAGRERLHAVQRLAPYDTGRQYLNFTEASTDPARFYRPDVFHRLRAVKAAYDPDNLFRANHPIPPASS